MQEHLKLKLLEKQEKLNNAKRLEMKYEKQVRDIKTKLSSYMNSFEIEYYLTSTLYNKHKTKQKNTKLCSLAAAILNNGYQCSMISFLNNIIGGDINISKICLSYLQHYCDEHKLSCVYRLCHICYVVHHMPKFYQVMYKTKNYWKLTAVTYDNDNLFVLHSNGKAIPVDSSCEDIIFLKETYRMFEIYGQLYSNSDFRIIHTHIKDNDRSRVFGLYLRVGKVDKNIGDYNLASNVIFTFYLSFDGYKPYFFIQCDV